MSPVSPGVFTIMCSVTGLQLLSGNISQASWGQEMTITQRDYNALRENRSKKTRAERPFWLMKKM
jgi:hypothetical protein